MNLKNGSTLMVDSSKNQQKVYKLVEAVVIKSAGNKGI